MRERPYRWYPSSHLKNIFQVETDELCQMLMRDEVKCISGLGNTELIGDLDTSIFNVICRSYNSYCVLSMPRL